MIDIIPFIEYKNEFFPVAVFVNLRQRVPYCIAALNSEIRIGLSKIRKQPFLISLNILFIGSAVSRQLIK